MSLYDNMRQSANAHTHLLQCSRSQLQDLVSGLVLLRGQQTVVAMVTQTLSAAHGLTVQHTYLHTYIRTHICTNAHTYVRTYKLFTCLTSTVDFTERLSRMANGVKPYTHLDNRDSVSFDQAYTVRRQCYACI